MTKYFPLFMLFFLGIVQNGFSQNDNNHQTFSTTICEFNLPAGRSGLSVTAFLVTPRIRIERHEKNAEILLEIAQEQGTSKNPSPSFTHSYNFMGKKYGNESVGFEPFEPIRAEYVSYEVLVTYGSQSWGWKNLGSGATGFYGPIDKNAKASEVMVRVRIANLSFRGTNMIEHKILELLKPKITATPPAAAISARPATSASPANSGSTTQKPAGTAKSAAQGNYNGNTSSSANNKGINAGAATGSNYQNTKTTSGSISNMSGTVKANGENVKVYQQNGKNYMQRADGTVHETSKQAYDAVQKASNTNIANKIKHEQQQQQAQEEQAAQIKRNQEDYQSRLAIQEAKAEKTRIMMEGATQLANIAGSLMEDWAASRERRWAAERAQYKVEQAAKARHESLVAANKTAYLKLVADNNSFLFKNADNYSAMLSSSLPQVLKQAPVTWEQVLGTTDYDHLFGKDIDYVSKKIKTDPLKRSLAAEFKKNKVEAVKLPDLFTQQELKLAQHEHLIFYWVKKDFYDHPSEFIFNKDKNLVGLRMALKTDDQAEPVHIKDYYDDLIKNLGSRYFMANGNTFVTSDKVFILDFDYLTIYDLSRLDPNTFFNFPKEFSSRFNPGNCTECIDRIGIKINGIKAAPEKPEVEIREIVPHSPAEKHKLQTGDIIIKINDINIRHPFQVQWCFNNLPAKEAITLTLRRANKTETISINP